MTEYDNTRQRFDPLYNELGDIGGISVKTSAGALIEDDLLKPKEVDRDLFIAVKGAIAEIDDLLDTLY